MQKISIATYMYYTKLTKKTNNLLRIYSRRTCILKMSEDSWVFDSLVCFLHGPVWNAALQTFIEEKSLSKFYKKIRSEIENQNFKALVILQMTFQFLIPTKKSTWKIPSSLGFTMNTKTWSISC